MNDLIDYFQAARDLDDDFEVHGRSLPALRRRMEEWHRMLRVMRLSHNERWVGRPIPDAVYRTEAEAGPAVWRMHQITNSDRTVSRGRAHAALRDGELQGPMQHGIRSSIWSLTCEYPIGTFNRGLTVEVDDQGMIVQCRGFANRLPFEDEWAILDRWARDCGLST